MKDNYNLFVNAEYAENRISVSIENRNSFRVSNIDMTVIYNDNVVILTSEVLSTIRYGTAEMSLMRTAHSIQSGIMRGRKCV